MDEKEPIPPGVYYFFAEDTFYITGESIYLLFNYNSCKDFREKWIGRKDEFPIYKVTKKEIV